MKNTDFNALLELIPQISYEIIGRITPGIVCIFSAWIVVDGPYASFKMFFKNLSDLTTTFDGWGALLLILSAYVVAFVLDGIWQSVSFLYAKVGNRIDQNVEDRMLKFIIQGDVEAPTNEYMADVLHEELPKSGAWLTKLYAEIHALQKIITCWILCALMNVMLHFRELSYELMLLEVGFLLGIVSLVVVRTNIRKTQERTLHHLWDYTNRR